MHRTRLGKQEDDGISANTHRVPMKMRPLNRVLDTVVELVIGVKRGACDPAAGCIALTGSIVKVATKQIRFVLCDQVKLRFT